MIEGDMARHLRTRNKIRNRVGSRGVFRGRIPQSYDGMVAIVLTRSGGDTYIDLTGETTLGQTIVNVEVVAKKANAEPIAEQLEEDIRDAISGYVGTWGSTYIQGCMKVSQPRESRTPPIDGSDDWTYRITTPYRVHYAQAAPTLGD